MKDSSLWHSNFIPSVHDSIRIIGSRFVTLYLWFVFYFINVGLGFAIKNLNFSFLGSVFQYHLLGLNGVSIKVRIIWY
jgi:hypothetical protein